MPMRTAGGPRPAGDEALHERGQQERDDEPDEHAARPARLVDERVEARSVAGVDDRPPDAQPGGAGDDDGRHLEHPVGEDQPPELVGLARRG